MSLPLVTLLTDFGPTSTYVAQLKGRLYGAIPALRLVDLAHDIPPHDVRRASDYLDACVDWYPAETIHVAVVDPGVGTNRRLLLARVARQYVLAPDNGLLTSLVRRLAPEWVRELLIEHTADGPVSATFHGRDVLAPAAARIARGESLDIFSRPVESWVTLTAREPQLGDGVIRGCVASIDTFGNVISNIDVSWLKSAPAGMSFTVVCRGQRVAHWVRTYGDAAPNTLVALVGSSGKVELAIPCGNAARALHASLDDELCIEWG